MVNNYSNVAVETALSAGITSVATVITVSSTSGFPVSTPFTLAVDADQATEELVSVTGVSGTSLTVTRGYDGTSAQNHSTGAKVRHVHAAIDFRLSRQHEAATSGVHGVTGPLVGTTDTQVLTNKDLTSSSNLFPSSLATDAEVATAASAAQAAAITAANSHADTADSTHAALTVAHGATGAVVGTTNTQALTNKDLTSGTNTFPPSLATLTGAQTLTNKTLAAPAIDAPVFTGVNWTTLTLTAPTGPSATWTTPTAARYIQFGPFVAIELTVQRATTDLTAGAAGNVPDDQVVASGIPAGIFPANNVYGDFVRGGFLQGSFRLDTAGLIWITDMYPTATLAVGQTIVLRTVYALG